MSIQTLLDRRSIRAYDPNYEIPEELLSKIIKAALNSPTALNRQDVDFVVCTNRGILQNIAEEVMNSGPETMRERFKDRQKKSGVTNPVTYDCPCVIFLEKNERAGDNVAVDAGIISMAIMIAAKAEGLDSVCLGSVKLGINEKTEPLLNVKKENVLLGVGIGKAKEGAEIVDKEIIAKVRYVK
ncbi:hypothetical protein M9Y10_012977 [Tritrichomonas musculus]|uniref:Nitroreductase domain-containing protein n=1 Tax=Tritrichomonas musculus TaxID=1915356 RepID=A0ABR2I6M3_9EUKA